MAEMFTDWIKPLIGPLVTAAFTLIGLFLMERWTSRRAERQEEKEQLETVKVYADPLLLSLVSLIYRLKEIFEGEAKFLSGKAPQNEYYRYMFRSTLYRLCAVLGWLRAANRELSGIEVKDQEAYRKIKEAITDFESALARGRFLAKSRLEFLTYHWKIPDDVLSRDNIDFLGGEIEQLIWDALHEENANYAYELDEDKQLALLNDVANLMIESFGLETFDRSILEKKRKSTIRAISRVESWIYRDWQAAIGDMMLVESLGAERRLEVIGFNRFEDLYLKHLSEGEQNNRWLERIIRLFRDLNLSRDDVFDARAQQLRNVCSAGVALVEVLSEVDFGVRKVAKAEWEPIQVFDRKNNERFYNKPTPDASEEVMQAADEARPQ